MVNTIQIFIGAARLSNYELHLSCVTERMLPVLAAAGHHNYAQGGQLDVQLMRSYETGTIKQQAVVGFYKNFPGHSARMSEGE